MNEQFQRAWESGSVPDLAAVSVSWALGFGLRKLDSGYARSLVERGATLTPHAAAGFGITDELAKMLAADPTVIDAKGGDGCTPLHFARDIATAELLLAHGARIDARDEDHDSTPAQWLIGEAPEIARFLVDRGARADLFLAAALGDSALAEKLIEADPTCVSRRIGRGPEFPPIGNGKGGTIYQWTLGFNSFAQQIALSKGHKDLFELIHARSDAVTRFLVACLLGRREEAQAIAAVHPGIVEALPASEIALLSYYCWETNLNFDAVRLMLDMGFPVRQFDRQHGHTPLHNAAWCGSAEVVALLLERGADVHVVDPNYDATAVGYALHSCLVAKGHPEGNFAGVVRLLLDAGCRWDPLDDSPTGDARLDEVFREHLPNESALGESPSPEELSRALGMAAKRGDVAQCEQLLALGAAVNGVAGRDGDTPLMRALGSGSDAVVALLLARGADLNVKNRYGTLALHFAAGYTAKLDTVRMLLEAGAWRQIQTANAHGRTPLSVATERGREDVATLFREFESRL